MTRRVLLVEVDEAVMSDKFDSWVEKVERVFFNALSDRQRFHLVVRLLSRCSWLLLLELFQHVEAISKRDFISLLPDCAVYRLLSYLDARTLLTACQVSKRWNSIISGNQRLWRNLCSRDGFLVPAEPSVEQLADTSFFKCLYLEDVRLLERLREGFYSESASLWLNWGSITTMFFYDGKLAAASKHNNTVHILCCTSGCRLATYSTHSENINQIKFDDNFIVTASDDCTAACWDVANGTRLKSFVGHTAAVFCVDFNTCVDILVTGSADCTIKIWSFTGGYVLRTLEFKPDNSADGFCVSKVEIWGAVDHMLQPSYSYHILAASHASDCLHLMNYEIQRNLTVLEKKDVLLFDDDDDVKLAGFCVVDSTIKVWRLEAFASSDFRDLTEIIFDSVDVCGQRLFFRRPLDRVIRLPCCDCAYHVGSGASFDVFLGDRSEVGFGLGERHDSLAGRGWLFVSRHNSESHFKIGLHERSSLDDSYVACICDTQWLDGIGEESVCGRPLVAVYNSHHFLELMELKPLAY